MEESRGQSNVDSIQQGEANAIGDFQREMCEYWKGNVRNIQRIAGTEYWIDKMLEGWRTATEASMQKGLVDRLCVAHC